MLNLLRKKRPIYPMSREAWERSYTGRDWDYLNSATESTRYVLLAHWLSSFERTQSILDVCCGEGLFHRHLRKSGYEKYVGIDISDVAIRRAQELSNEVTTFQVADAETFSPSETFTAIVFNECLYYMRDPVGMVNRYSGFLGENGILAISIFTSDLPGGWLKQLAQSLNLLETASITNERGTWQCMVGHKHSNLSPQ